MTPSPLRHPTCPRLPSRSGIAGRMSRGDRAGRCRTTHTAAVHRFCVARTSQRAFQDRAGGGLDVSDRDPSSPSRVDEAPSSLPRRSRQRAGNLALSASAQQTELTTRLPIAAAGCARAYVRRSAGPLSEPPPPKRPRSGLSGSDTKLFQKKTVLSTRTDAPV